MGTSGKKPSKLTTKKAPVSRFLMIWFFNSTMPAKHSKKKSNTTGVSRLMHELNRCDRVNNSSGYERMNAFQEI
jgi:hypothetical protein